ncbi:carbamoyl-phosphate synthase (glutamine-hydrolyzing) large subunit [Oceanobacillus sp. J11TS1]|uniref:carbamoyl-phosphate synthase (glutamine-hydrolyzing) large subunit n=1 Tax=Oceanobacillus sp. J11TS1 TaxID=2807191 RepID=UPI001B129C51|nr:carbamoyl-phosphate synthase (glutamine-hydrolyzing) large subunit [Oceanobacillus sp. J11TS1]GIO21577.1 carbamoyl phosphate synthase large subunit [Oceanobacillus sp. J11TS1]
MPLHPGIKKVLVLGSGPIVIGQAAEFDYAGTQACLALKEEGLEVVLINNNPATIMTDEAIADQVYLEPLEVEVVEKIIAKENPDGLIGTLGGQTGLNLSLELHNKGILKKYDVELLGTSIASIQKGEDRERFRDLMISIEEPISESQIVTNLEDGLTFVEEIGYPVILRPAYTLGGEGGGFANNQQEFCELLAKGLHLSPIHQVLVERSIKGWKEIEYEIMRDETGSCQIVCDMENVDPVGVHTGDSIVVAPTQTLTANQSKLLRDASIKIIGALEVVGGCNIQFALHPETDEYCIIEVNPRVSRSSALASKATGYPIARVAAKCAVGYHLDELVDPVSGATYFHFTPELDYTVVKIPRFPFDKFSEADRTLGTQMKATGEVMSLDKTFEGALNKAVRSMELNVQSLHWPAFAQKTDEELIGLLEQPNDLRLFAIAEALRRHFSIAKLFELTFIQPYFLERIAAIIKLEKELAGMDWEDVTKAKILQVKEYNISDTLITKLFNIRRSTLRQFYKKHELAPHYRYVDTCPETTGENSTYFYSTWLGDNQVHPVTHTKKVLVVGSGPIRIGQGIEFDYCSVHAVQALQKAGYEAVMINNNPETVSTDYTVADRLYFEPLAFEDVWNVIEKENIQGVLIQFGGQTAINLTKQLQEAGISVLGTTPENMDKMEDREQFYAFLEQLNIAHIHGEIVHDVEQAKEAVHQLGYPVLIRPSYVIGGQSMFVCYNKEELISNVERVQADTYDRCWPLLVDSYMPGLECEVDVVSDGEIVIMPGIFEHIEKAGVHSGDSTSVFPAITLTEQQKMQIYQISKRIAKELPIIGMMNIQFVVYQGKVYVLEVNPRSSRTVPVISKVTGIPMVALAVNAQLGESLQEFMNQFAAYKEPDYYTVKAPVFSKNKLKGVDHILGPEMKSTGEAIGMDMTLEKAIRKAIIPASHTLNSTKKWFVSISDKQKEDSLPFMRQIAEKADIIATEGTSTYLQNNQISSLAVGRQIATLKKLFIQEPPNYVINVPSVGRDKERFGFQLRELCIQLNIPYFTCIETAKLVWRYQHLEHADIQSLQDYLKTLDKVGNATS